jgi:hypothetical protein
MLIAMATVENQDERIYCSNKSNFQHCEVWLVKAHARCMTILKVLEHQAYFYKARALLQTSPPTSTSTCFCSAFKSNFFFILNLLFGQPQHRTNYNKLGMKTKALLGLLPDIYCTEVTVPPRFYRAMTTCLSRHGEIVW